MVQPRASIVLIFTQKISTEKVLQLLQNPVYVKKMKLLISSEIFLFEAKQAPKTASTHPLGYYYPPTH